MLILPIVVLSMTTLSRCEKRMVVKELLDMVLRWVIGVMLSCCILFRTDNAGNFSRLNVRWTVTESSSVSTVTRDKVHSGSSSDVTGACRMKQNTKS